MPKKRPTRTAPTRSSHLRERARRSRRCSLRVVVSSSCKFFIILYGKLPLVSSVLRVARIHYQTQDCFGHNGLTAESSYLYLATRMDGNGPLWSRIFPDPGHCFHSLDSHSGYLNCPFILFSGDLCTSRSAEKRQNEA